MGFRDFANKIFPPSVDEEVYDEFEGQDEVFEEQDRNVRASEGSSYGSRGVGISTGGSSIEMKVVTPKSYDTVGQIADLLLEKKTVLLNLENTNRETARRLIDFLSGVAYALRGDVQKVADNTYAVTPSNVAVSNESVSDAGLAAEIEE